MANVYAVKSGNWSDTTLWNTGSLPAVIDDVYANNFTVYVDINTKVSKITNLAATSINKGGYFIINNNISLSADVEGGGTGTTAQGAVGAFACLQFLSASPSFATLYGNISSRQNDGTIIYPVAFRHNGTGIFNIYGNCLGSMISGTAGFGVGYVCNRSSGTLNVSGNILGGFGADYIYGVSNDSTGLVTIMGNISGGTGSRSFGVNNNSTGTVNVTGNIFSGLGQSAYGLNNASTGTISIIGNIKARDGSSDATQYGTFMAAGTATIVGSVSGGLGGTGPTGLWVNGGLANVFGNVYSGSGSIAHGIRNQAGGTVNLVGNAYGVGNTAAAIHNQSSTGTINVTGNCYGSMLFGTALGASTNAGTININGSVFGGNGSGASGVSNGLAIITVSGSAIGGPGSAAYGALNNSTGILRVKRAVGNEWGLGYTTAVASVPGVFSNNQGSQTFVEELECGPRGQWPTGGVIFFTPNTRATSMFETDTFQNYSLIQSNSADNLVPPVSSVRQGEVYDLGMDIGTCVIPPISSVAAGTLVDNLTGTAVLTPQTTWNYPTTASDVNSMGGRLRNALNTNSANSLINSFNP